MECISLRYFNTYGPGENTKSQYASVVWRFIYALDTARASFIAMLHGKSRESYNIGTGVSTTFNDIYAIVREEMQSELEAEHVPNPLANYQYFTRADMAKTRRDLGFMPEYDLRSEIRSMLQNDTTLLRK